VFEADTNNLTTLNDLSGLSVKVASNLDSVRNFLSLLASAVNKASINSSTLASDIDAWKAGVATARTNVDTAISNLTAGEEKWSGAKSSLELAQKELLVKQAGSRSEDVALAEADIAKAQGDLDGLNERISRSTIYAPTDGLVKKVLFEVGEVEVAGEKVVSISSTGSQVEAEISELDIVKISVGQPVEISFDAFPGQNFTGKVISIDPEELDRDGDTYYKVNFSIENTLDGIRSGMSSDIKVNVTTKNGIMTVPSIAMYKRDGKEYVKILRQGKTEEVAIKTGISDGDNLEIISGLNLGDEVVISAD
jgi:HlyD family secretion protein